MRTIHIVGILATLLIAFALLDVFLGEVGGAPAFAQGAFSALESLTVVKTAGVTVAAPGQIVTFVLTASADFSGTVQLPISIMITETLPGSLSFVGATPGFSNNAGNIVWSRPFSPALGYETVTFTARLADSLLAYTPIVNTDYRARILNTEVAGAPVTLTVASVPGLVLGGVPSPQYVEEGESFGLRYPLTNTGNFTDTFDFSIDLQSEALLTNWQISQPPSVTLPAGGKSTVEAWVTVGHGPAGKVATATLFLTGTSMLGAMENVATDIVVRYHSYIYLPLLLRSYPPKPLITSAMIQTSRGGPGYTYVPGVQVTVSATVENDVVQDLRFRTADGPWSDWLLFASDTSHAYTFAGDSGYKVLYIEARGVEGGISDPYVVSVSLLYNGDFGAGVTSWGMSNQVMPLPSITDGRALLGNQSWACHPAPIGSASIYQSLDLTNIPVGRTIMLYLDYDIYTEDKLLPGDYDRFVVLVDGQEIHRDGYSGTEPYGCGKWHQVTRTNDALDLTVYRGRMIQILFGNFTRYDDWYNTYTVVDNIHLVVQ